MSETLFTLVTTNHHPSLPTTSVVANGSSVLSQCPASGTKRQYQGVVGVMLLAKEPKTLSMTNKIAQTRGANVRIDVWIGNAVSDKDDCSRRSLLYANATGGSCCSRSSCYRSHPSFYCSLSRTCPTLSRHSHRCWPTSLTRTTAGPMTIMALALAT